jgi:hypothetical protein
VVATVDIVSHEDVRSIGYLASFVEQFKQVVKLSVDVSADSNWGGYRLATAFFYKDFFNFFTKLSEITLAKNISRAERL